MLPVRSRLAFATSAALSLLLSSCDMANVLSTPKQPKVAVGFQNDSTLVIATSFKPAVDVTLDGDAIVDPQIRLISSDTTVIAVSASGDSLIARKLGRAIITAVLEGTLLPSPSPRAVDTIYVVPKEFSLDRTTVTFTALGDTVRLVATATDALNRAIPNLAVVWTSSDTSKATVSPTGLVTSKANTGSPVTISAQMEGVSASSEVSVAQEIARFAFQPSAITLDAIGAQGSVSVSARDRNNNPIPVLPSIAWTSGNAAIVSVHPANGTYVSLDNGRTYIRATATSGQVTVTDTVHVEVNQQAVRVSIIAPFGTTIAAIGAKLQLDGRAYDRLNSEVRKKISWSTVDADKAGVDTTGLVAARATGDAYIVARVDTASATQMIRITNEAVRLSLDPPSSTLASVNDSLTLVVTASNALGASIPGSGVTWTSSDSTVVKVLAPGLVRAERAGSANIIVTSGALTAQALVTVTNAADQIDIAATSLTLASVGDSVTPAVTVTNARGAAVATTSLLWSSDDIAVARVTATGTVIATGPGATFIKATNPTNITRRDSVLITVTNAPASIILSDTRDTLTALGRSRTYTATVRNGRGARIADAVVNWQSSQPAVASVVDGTAVAQGLGTTIISATSGSATATIEVTVTNDAVSLDIQPASLTMTAVNDTVRLSVAARNDLGNLIPATQVVWTSTVTSVATVDSRGSVASHAVGNARIVGTIGLLADTVFVTVTNTPATINIVPDTVHLLALGDSVSPAAVLLNSRGVALARTAATWSSDDPTVARVTAYGMIVARDTGTTVIRATSGSVSDAVVVVISNAPAFVVLPITRDTLTAPGQQVEHTARVANATNNVIDGARVVWTSSNTAVATASGSGATGVVTATGFGSAFIIARAGAVADTFQLFVVNPTRLYVDNSVFVSPRTGTNARPYAKIQDAVNAADPFDTVFVRKGSGAYSETVALSKRIVLLGDSTNFNKSVPNPVVLPLISHDTGTAGITAITTSPQTIRFFQVRHTADGAALYARGPEIRVNHLYVNEGEVSRLGSGLAIDNSTSGALASVTQVRVNSVRGYGISFTGVTNGIIRGVSITGVDSIPVTTGSGIFATNSNGLVIDSATIRLTGGPQIHLQFSSTVTLSNSNLAGRNQLVRLLQVSGSSQILNNTFNLQLQSGQPFTGGSAEDGRAGLTIDGSQNVLVRDNVFTDPAAAMDAIRISGSRGAGQYAGALFQSNQFTGGRYHVRSAASTWSSIASRSTNAVQAVLGESTDTVSMRLDTVTTATLGCVNLLGFSSRITVYGGTFSTCASGSASTMQAAVRVSGGASSISVDSSYITGANTIAVEHDGGGALSFTRSVVFANGTRTLPRTGIRGVIATSNAVPFTVTGSRVRGYSDLAAVHVPSGLTATVSSNHFSRNRVGLRALAGSIVTAADNDWFDNDSAGVVYTATSTITNAFWGDPRGPERATDPMATGDSALGLPVPTVFRAVPTFAGTGAAELRVIRGQTTTTPTRPAATVRVVDVNGLPVAGVSVTFSCTLNCGSGNNNNRVQFENSPTLSAVVVTGTSVTVVTNAAGLAEVLVDQKSPTATRTSTLRAATANLETEVVVTTLAP